MCRGGRHSSRALSPLPIPRATRSLRPLLSHPTDCRSRRAAHPKCQEEPMANLACAVARRVLPLLSFALAALCTGGSTMAQQASPPPEGGLSLDLEVVAKQLDVARQQIQPNLGATVYDFGRQAIETQPQGDNQQLNQLLLQAPVSRKTRSGRSTFAATTPICNTASTGFSSRRANVFGQALQTRLANSVSLITGALPAQYG